MIGFIRKRRLFYKRVAVTGACLLVFALWNVVLNYFHFEYDGVWESGLYEDGYERQNSIRKGLYFVCIFETG